jgi:hypothetical protein
MMRILFKQSKLLTFTLILFLSSARFVAGQTAVSEWTQDAHDAQRTGYTIEEPVEPWALLWSWNGPDASGGTGGHVYDAPPEARTVTGGSSIYVPAGGKGLFALAKQTGAQVWNIPSASFNAAPAYDSANGWLFAGGADGKLYKINGSDGAILQTYDAGSPLNKAVLLAGEFAYVVTDSGELHKVSMTDLSAAWVYAANAPIATPPAYSPSRDAIIYATNDLFVHAVNNADGKVKWHVKPTPNRAGFPYEMDGMWPVIAEKHGIVFVRMRLAHDALWSGPGKGSMYPTSNAETRALLESKPELKNLFALSLDTGAEAFVPAVGYGGVEALIKGKPYLDIGGVPVIRNLPDGTEAAYQVFRSGQGDPPDGRWDSHFGEMVLDDQMIPGLAAGDLRFIQTKGLYLHITDEQMPITMAGDTFFNAHWAASESAKILDRSAGKGLTAADPIPTQRHPTVIRRMQACPNFDPVTHWTTCGLTLFEDGRYWDGPGWWVYWNVIDPLTPRKDQADSAGILSRYTYVSDGLIVVQGNAGELSVFKYGSSATAITQNPTPSGGTVAALPTATTASATAAASPVAIDGPTFQISADQDDVNEEGKGFAAVGTSLWIGTASDPKASFTGLHFRKVSIPQGAHITAARLEFYSTTSQWLPIQLEIAADAADNSAVFSNASRPSARTLTTARVSHDSNASWDANTWYVFDDMSAVVQEIINRPGWKKDNSLSIILHGTADSPWGRKFVASYARDAATAVRLAVSYQ